MMLAAGHWTRRRVTYSHVNMGDVANDVVLGVKDRK
jgi:hypothetical protein